VRPSSTFIRAALTTARVVFPGFSGLTGRLLCLSSSRGGLCQCSVDLPGDVAFQASRDLAFGLAFGQEPFQVGAGVRVGSQPGQYDRVDRPVESSIAATTEPVPGCVAR